MKRSIGRLIYALSHWKMEVKVPPETLKKSVLIAAPHTSNWDLFYALSGFWTLGLDAKFFIKDYYTRSRCGRLFKALGGIGVNRQQRNNLTRHAIDLLNNSDQLVLMIPPEGTRKRVEKWKTGFYHIAQGAGVPIALGVLDYRLKTAGINKILYPTGHFEADMKIIEDYYRGRTGKYPEKFNPKIF